MFDDGSWVTPGDAARALGVSPLRCRQWLADGRLEGIRTPLGHLFTTESVERLVRLREEIRRVRTPEVIASQA